MSEFFKSLDHLLNIGQNRPGFLGGGNIRNQCIHEVVALLLSIETAVFIGDIDRLDKDV